MSFRGILRAALEQQERAIEQVLIKTQTGRAHGVSEQYLTAALAAVTILLNEHPETK